MQKFQFLELSFEFNFLDFEPELETQQLNSLLHRKTRQMRWFVSNAYARNFFHTPLLYQELLFEILSSWIILFALDSFFFILVEQISRHNELKLSAIETRHAVHKNYIDRVDLSQKYTLKVLLCFFKV